SQRFSMNQRTLLEQVRDGRLTIDTALAQLQQAAAIDLGYAQVDLHRRLRCGFPEVIFCEGKTPAHVEGVVRELHTAGQDCLATRVNDEQADHLARHFPHGEQDRVGRTFWLRSANEGSVAPDSGKVAIVTAGTADLPVAHEALATVKAMGCPV